MLKTKKISSFRPLVLSRHPSHDVLKTKSKNLPLLPVRSVIRFGSSTEVDDVVSKGGNRVEINTVDAIKISANKKLMKEKFVEANVRTAPFIFYTAQNFKEELQKLGYPIVAKAHYGSKGKGNTLIKTEEEFDQWCLGKTLSNYIYEKFVNYALEYRFHITKNGCFYVCRKALKGNCPEDQKWRHHDDTCVWFLETNENFMKPNSFNQIIEHCVKALNTIGADVLSFDVKVQSPKNKDGSLRDYQDFILLECNSASSMDNGTGELSMCAKAYIKELPKIIMSKI